MIDLTGDDDEAEGWGLDGGDDASHDQGSKGLNLFELLRIQELRITVWENEEAERTVDKPTNIRGDPHKKARRPTKRGTISIGEDQEILKKKKKKKKTPHSPKNTNKIKKKKNKTKT
ncbi:hypothetical protein GCM10020218_042920 [Dactylosporangium vinaceum]